MFLKGNFKNVSPKCLLETLNVSGPIILIHGMRVF